MTVRPSIEDRPDGPGFSPTVWDYERRIRVVRNHGRFEGADVDGLVTLNSYDRTLHPDLHGRRAHDIVVTLREVLGL
ncbi:hypothetical protein [Haloarcula sebkhae]|uniref:Uncharacterized protein n=2 Tax=Haloarcula sebkhae TaxID=932660 RepID=A0ACC6VIG4_9EURY|nr:hypothetical protein [Haloarcula sebkhae]GGK74272.1 hypothetical protein GCM10009067_28080 [Haloarcula sebkhae]